MSCNGCRVLRKGCSENCILRPCIQWIESAEATATPPSSSLNSSAVPVNVLHLRRTGISMPWVFWSFTALFQSLLYEACGRTVNPVNDAVGLLSTGNWNICQAAVETVLRGGSLRHIPELLTRDRKNYHHCRFSTSRSPPKWKRLASEQQQRRPPSELDLSLIPTFPIQTTAFKEETRRPETPSMYSEESVTTTTFPDSTAGERFVRVGGETTKLLNLFT
ncbi:hypothetical protein Bca4012_088962 [Brassica carinata]|uniref:LOB domain-containing protein n=1 Tax=Brassica carinata TaxID=52824 RepID=A0A8X7P9R8_BRACI|nr:hypothetical protein Bca52824_087454 [Brassica carinata]